MTTSKTAATQRSYISCLTRREDRWVPLDAHVPDEDPLTGLRAPHGAHVVLRCQGVRARSERRKRDGARGAVLHAQGDDLHGVAALLRHELLPQAQRDAREPVVDHRVEGITLVRVSADAVASHGYLQERKCVHFDYDPRPGRVFQVFPEKPPACAGRTKTPVVAHFAGSSKMG